MKSKLNLFQISIILFFIIIVGGFIKIQLSKQEMEKQYEVLDLINTIESIHLKIEKEINSPIYDSSYDSLVTLQKQIIHSINELESATQRYDLGGAFTAGVKQIKKDVDTLKKNIQTYKKHSGVLNNSL